LAIGCVPGLGFLMWLIGFPLAVAAFVFGIMAANRGRTLGGIVLIFSSFAAGTLFFFIPIISGAAGLIGILAGS